MSALKSSVIVPEVGRWVLRNSVDVSVGAVLKEDVDNSIVLVWVESDQFYQWHKNIHSLVRNTTV